MYDDEIAEVIEYHHSMLTDGERTASFLRAILETVRPGDVVLDIGTGTGVLAAFACLAGARHVYAVEHGPVIALARRVIEANGLGDRVTLLHDWSTGVELPEPADVLITETIGNLGFEEGILGWVIDATERLVKPEVRLVPQAVSLWAAPIDSASSYRLVGRWSEDVFALDFTPVQEVAADNLYWAEISPASLLAAPAEVMAVDLASISERSVAGSARFVARRDGVLHGLGAWFHARLSPSVSIDTAPPIKAPSWNHGFFPLEDPIEVRAGDEIDATIDVEDNGATWAWSAAVVGRAHGGGRHETRRGGLAAEIRTVEGELRPRRSVDADVDAAVLAMMDGSVSVEEMAASIRHTFPVQFVTDDHAFAHVEDLVVRYARDTDSGA